MAIAQPMCTLCGHAQLIIRQLHAILMCHELSEEYEFPLPRKTCKLRDLQSHAVVMMLQAPSTLCLFGNSVL